MSNANVPVPILAKAFISCIAVTSLLILSTLFHVFLSVSAQNFVPIYFQRKNLRILIYICFTLQQIILVQRLDLT
jgi:hypothetical protein